jgi:hypothetical protein
MLGIPVENHNGQFFWLFVHALGFGMEGIAR